MIVGIVGIDTIIVAIPSVTGCFDEMCHNILTVATMSICIGLLFSPRLKRDTLHSYLRVFQ